MTDESFQAAEFQKLSENESNQKLTSTRKTYASAAYGFQKYTPSQTKKFIYAEEFLAKCLSFTEIVHLF